jgi:hypothetical protein
MHVAQHCTRRVTMVKNPVTSDDKRGKTNITTLSEQVENLLLDD